MTKETTKGKVTVEILNNGEIDYSDEYINGGHIDIPWLIGEYEDEKRELERIYKGLKYMRSMIISKMKQYNMASTNTDYSNGLEAEIYVLATAYERLSNGTVITLIDSKQKYTEYAEFANDGQKLFRYDVQKDTFIYD